MAAIRLHPQPTHSREYVPLITFGKQAKAGVNLGTRDSMADIGQTIGENFRQCK
jgi:phosphopentomutase